MCPRCRAAGPAGLTVHALERQDRSFLACPGCRTRYPVVDEVPFVLAALDEWLASEAAAVLARRDLRPELEELLAPAAGGAIARDRGLLASYASPEGELVSAIDALVGELEGEILDLGCGNGLLHGRADVTGLDTNFSLVRAFPGRGILGDAADPPFLAGSCDAVLLLNLLDSCRRPRLVLAQADALLKPGGLLVISCPYRWEHGSLDDPRDRFGPEALLNTLQGQADTSLELSLDYALERVEDPLTWRLATGLRSVHEMACQLVVARKQAG